MAAYPPEETVKRPTITGRRNLRNFKFQKPRTDFETWDQAESALQNGVTVEELVRREFVRTLGEDQVQYASLPTGLWIAPGLESLSDLNCTIKHRHQISSTIQQLISMLCFVVVILL